ncbi:MAG TPA: isoprenyl transferase [Candidatus Dormibacteraeota bacterium]|jgi:undecaprenyl diphosphate synthase|nr:isoprenyl transferase [Candidatus Dormibacteraeota bacterium]
MQRPPIANAVPPPPHEGLPRHIGIIMDGNGRWASGRHLPRIAGHRAGVGAIRPVMEECDRLGVHVLTLYAFSTENWSRPSHEVGALMDLFVETIRREIDELHQNGVQVRILGRRQELSPRLQEVVVEAEAQTRANHDAVLNIAINYGGRAEIVDAVRELAAQGADLTQLDEEQLSRALYTGGLPDPDLIIRTAGEMRVSNFLLWQAAYAELWVTDTLWPDFGERELGQALRDFAERERKFGKVGGSQGPARRGLGLDGIAQTG